LLKLKHQTKGTLEIRREKKARGPLGEKQEAFSGNNNKRKR